MTRYALIILLLMVSCCTPLPQAVQFNPDDLVPPVLLSMSETAPGVLELDFDKPAWLQAGQAALDPPSPIIATEEGTTRVRIQCPPATTPGEETTLSAVAADSRGNKVAFCRVFYRRNPDPPTLLINEVVTSASTTVPTQVELFVAKAGNLGGLVLCEGTLAHPDAQMVFPAMRVAAGDYILVHFKPDGLPGETDETTSKTSASGKGSSPTAWDFWVPGSGNLSADNECITLYLNGQGTMLDALVYSTRVFTEGARYQGFGTLAMLEKCQEIAAAGQWDFGSADPVPDLAFNPTGATSRRSMNRSSGSADTNAKADWHIVPVGAATFGQANSDQVYVP